MVGGSPLIAKSASLAATTDSSIISSQGCGSSSSNGQAPRNVPVKGDDIEFTPALVHPRDNSQLGGDVSLIRGNKGFYGDGLASFTMKRPISKEEADLQTVKAKLIREWAPEYVLEEVRPPQDSLDVHSERATNVTLGMVLKHQEHLARKTKIICTAGPACWSEEKLEKLLQSGMNVLRLNFSHGDQEGHFKVLDRFRKVCSDKGYTAASLLDTKGPEIRTAMLRDHKAISLEAGQAIIVEAVGDRYTSWEGYKDENETRIGLSYEKLCQSVEPGGKILLADGTITIQVDEIISPTELRGTVLNSKSLGERKNGNLPGVKVDIPVLTAKDIDDLQNFAAKHKVDFVAASFVQSASDVEFIRYYLDEAGASHIKIISKIENLEGLNNFDEILEATDGIMVARGDLGMEIPSEKVPVAQKMMISKCNVAGKPVICATQMLESMISNPRPTRAEMTDVANAVYDGVDCVMLSGETANGEFPEIAVSTMAAICANAETGVDYYSQFNFIRYWASKGNALTTTPLESMLSSAASMSVSFYEDTTPEVMKARGNGRENNHLIACVSKTGLAANMVSKYRPPCCIVVASDDERVLRQTAIAYGQLPLKVSSLELNAERVAELAAQQVGKSIGMTLIGPKVIVAVGRVRGGDADVDPAITILKLPGGLSKGNKNWSTVNQLLGPSGVPIQRPGVRSLRSTNTNLSLITKPLTSSRSTHILCTMGPKCWSEEMLGKLLDAGMDIVRLNFSHGDHAGHFEVLERFRKVAAAKGEELKKKGGLVTAPLWGTLLDTKGPEIRTAMLHDHKAISLEAGQAIIVEAVGDRYTSWEGYKDENETRIGLSYEKLCQSVEPGGKILLADGTITIQVDEIISPTELRGTVLNSKSLGERKNGNLPGVKVDIPVLTAKDIDDLQNFAAKHKVDYVAASFVQSAADVQFIRDVLDEAGGYRVKIISKIENAAGLQNYDEILRESDGIMVARGDLGMEIPAEKVPLAQKMMITKANISGKFIVTATQMLESMISNPRPTRAEMTDVANAVIDGTDCVMLSGETANGDFPVDAVATMAAICVNAEEMVDVGKRYDFLRNQTPKPMMGAEALCSGAVQSAIDCNAKLIVCITSSGRAPGLVSKYRPSSPVVVVTPDEQLARHCRSTYGQVGMLYKDTEGDLVQILEHVATYLRSQNIVDLKSGDNVAVVKRRFIPSGVKLPHDDQRLIVKTLVYGQARPVSVGHSAYRGKRIIYHRSTKIGLDTILEDNKYKHMVRKTKILCTAGPACWSEEKLSGLLDAGMNVLRLNFSHGDQKGHFDVLQRYRKVCAQKKVYAAALLDTKGPEIRTAMLRDHKAISLEAGQAIIVEAVGDRYTSWEGYKDENETRIGLSYEKLCQSVEPGGKILLADGTITIQVDEIISPTELRGTVLNSKSLGERKNGNLPGVKVDIPVLLDKDIDDLQNFAAKHQLDFVAASFVQSKADVLFIRRILDEAGGKDVKIISKIENAAGLQNYDEILEVTDGIMVARGDLGMEIPAEKVPLAQKMMITKANISGKFVITATQMMESMITNPIPTRAEMTDVANAVLDGTDCVMLSGETANGAYPEDAVATMGKICRSAEIGVNFYQSFDFVRTFTPKPISPIEAIVCSLAKNAVDLRPGMIVVFSENGKTARLIAKYRPCAPVLLVTSNVKLARACSTLYSVYPMLLGKPISSTSEIQVHIDGALKYGVENGLCMAGKEVLVLTSTSVAAPAAAAGDQAKALLQREVMVTLAPGTLDHQALGNLAPSTRADQDPKLTAKTISVRSTVIDLDMLTQDHAPVRKTKICVTIGPSCSSEATLRRLVDEGMDLARFKFTHGKRQQHSDVLSNLRSICKEKGRSVATLMDLQGPEIRTSYLVDSPESRQRIDKLELKAGDNVLFYGTEQIDEDKFIGYRKADGTVVLGVDLMDFVDVVTPETIIRLRDGAIGIKITGLTSDGTKAEGVVLNAGLLGDRRVVHIAGVVLHASPSSTRNDMQDILDFAIENSIDYVAASQVSGRHDVETLRQFLVASGLSTVKIIAKIETAEGLRSLDEIIDEADGIMLARGNLGMAIAPEKVALAQSLVITKCKVLGKPVIVARHMLESMTSNPRPTRAEMTDVCNAVLDSADCVMLCSETANGDFPIESLVTASKICCNAEAAMNYGALHSFVRDFSAKPFGAIEAAASSLAKSCTDAHLSLAVVISDSGAAADVISKFRPNVPLIVVTSLPNVAAQACLHFGQRGFLVTERDFNMGGSASGALGSKGGLLVNRAIEWAVQQGILVKTPGEMARVAVMTGYIGADTAVDSNAVVSVLEV